MPRRPDSARSSRAKPWWELKPESYRGATIRKVRDKYRVESPGLGQSTMPFTKKRLAKEWIDRIKADPKRFGYPFDAKKRTYWE